MGQRCREHLKRVLTSKDRPEAICCATARIGYVAEGVAAELGLKIPDDLALIACDGVHADVQGGIGMTTVGISREETCRRALEVLDQVSQEPWDDKPSIYEPTVMPLHLTVRDSCGARVRGAEAIETRGRQFVRKEVT